MKLNVCEIFHAIQGEGKYVGTNVVFIRLGGCTLNCDWCDSKYHKDYISKEIDDIVKDVKKYKSDRIVITGGEPLLQQEFLVFLLQKLKSEYHITIETNGTVIPSSEILILTDHFACSPKLSGSGNELAKRLNYDALQVINKADDSIFKFVITNDKDLDEVKLIEEQVPLNHNKIYLMKEGASKKEQEEGLDVFINMCRDEGYHFSPRIQVMVFDVKRAV
jgi:7-carboxy-7-deazaguanine synthase